MKPAVTPTTILLIKVREDEGAHAFSNVLLHRQNGYWFSVSKLNHFRRKSKENAIFADSGTGRTESDMESLVRRLVRSISRKGKHTNPPERPLRDTEGLEAALERWVAEKGYRKPYRTVNETAGELGTDGVRLHHYFHDRMHADFRTWRTRLRLEDAKRLLVEEPGTTAAEDRKSVV